MERKILTASDGMILTDGKTYGKIIYLAIGADENTWYEITEAEYEEIINDEEATEADYEESLERFGVK